MSEINVTPLVDVMLVLLIVFMISAPLLTAGVPLELPETRAAQLTDVEEPLVVSIDAEGAVWIGEIEVEPSELAAKLRAMLASKPDSFIYIRGDRGIAYGRVMSVMGALSHAGFSRLSLLAEIPREAR